MSNSYLGRLGQCPAKAKVAQLDTPTLVFGRAAHCYILQGTEIFNRDFAVCPDIDKRTKEGKTQFASFAAANINKQVLTPDDYLTIQAMNDAIRNHPAARELLIEGASEQTVIWEDKDTGLFCKARPDWIPSHIDRIMVDLKTTRDADWRAFQRSVISYGYARQAAMYITGLLAAASIEIDMFMIIAVEPEPPHRVEVYQLDLDFIAWGFGEFKRLLKLELECRQMSVWPNYKNPDVVPLAKPGYLWIDDNYQ